MYLWLISQNVNNTYDTYDSAVVCAPDEETARNMNPGLDEPMDWVRAAEWEGRPGWTVWAWRPSQVNVKRIGVAEPGTSVGVICASFNAG